MDCQLRLVLARAETLAKVPRLARYRTGQATERWQRAQLALGDKAGRLETRTISSNYLIARSSEFQMPASEG
jgi:hypothetical protein